MGFSLNCEHVNTELLDDDSEFCSDCEQII